MILEILFWLSVVFILYTYAGYPLLITQLAKRCKPVEGDPGSVSDWPSVSIVIPVHNEEHNISRKVQNLRCLDYPSDKIDIIFVSDGSDDNTNAILKKSEGITCYDYFPRKGKPSALNLAVSRSQAEVILFTDVRQELDPGSLKYLVSTLLKKNVGAVSGELVHRDPVTHTGKNIGLYWRYEKWIRRAESRVHSTAGVTGALYVIRRTDYVPLREDTLLDDFEVPIQILRKGSRVLFDSRAKIYDDVQEDTRSEQTRKVRTLTGNYQSFMRNPWLFVPAKNRILLQFLSHKVFRVMVPYALMICVTSSMLLPGVLYNSLFALQVLFYALALSATLVPSMRMNRIVNLVVVFVSLNWAALLALKNYLFNQVEIRWEKT